MSDTVTVAGNDEYDSSEDEDFVPSDDSEYEQENEMIEIEADEKQEKEKKKTVDDIFASLQSDWKTKKLHNDVTNKTTIMKEKEKTMDGEKTRIKRKTETDLPKKPVVKKTKGLSGVMELISQPKNISTFQKSKLDWEGYKEKEGIQEELSNQTKSSKSFLLRREFLERTDHRLFEKEKSQRDFLRKKSNT
eukprot:GCRY01000991.1.p1 GENE.GCRY01000991.1~~GCRY01000991.1.p1  ORF type:complete len:191 (-),score=35.05 GCRY01000991.1:13-585(-)